MKKTVQLEKSLMDIVQIVAKTEGKTIGVYITEAVEEKLNRTKSPKNGRTILERGNVKLQITTK
jgi:hypothetical protein